MTTSEIFLAILAGLVAAFYLRRFLRYRSIRQYHPREVRELLAGSRPVVLLDVRTDAERKEQSIRGSLHIPLHALIRRSEELRKHTGREIVCYCRTGSRSLEAAARLQKEGYTAASMKGGIAEWNFSTLER